VQNLVAAVSPIFSKLQAQLPRSFYWMVKWMVKQLIAVSLHPEVCFKEEHPLSASTNGDHIEIILR
jgi:hypothetical protein